MKKVIIVVGSLAALGIVAFATKKYWMPSAAVPTVLLPKPATTPATAQLAVTNNTLKVPVVSKNHSSSFTGYTPLYGYDKCGTEPCANSNGWNRKIW